MRFPRSSGILLHPTSLPGAHGIGDLGSCAFEFADFLHDAGQTVWQVLPLNPPGYGESPYQCYSAMAGNPMLVHVDAPDGPRFSEDCVDFERVIPYKHGLLENAATRFFETTKGRDLVQYEEFCHANQSWLDDYTLFIALKDAHAGVA